MILHIQPAIGERFRIINGTLPIVINIHSEALVEIAGEPMINAVFLTKEGHSDTSFGFSRSITRIPGESLIIDKEHPYTLCVDALQYDDDLTGLTFGRYEMKVDVAMYVRDGLGGLKPFELTKFVPVTLE